MDTPKTFINTRKIAASIYLMFALLLVGSKACEACPVEQAKVGPLIVDKISAHIAEESFWGLLPSKVTELKLILLVSKNQSKRAEFDVLAIIPEINETLEIRKCDEEPAIIVKGWGNSEPGRAEAERYLRNELERFSDFVAHAGKSETLIQITSDPTALFNSDSAFKIKRIEQIKLALGALIHDRPLRLRVANFSRFTDQIDVLVSSQGKMYTMSVVRASCREDSVEVGREVPLKSVRADLRKKLEVNSVAEVIR